MIKIAYHFKESNGRLKIITHLLLVLKASMARRNVGGLEEAF
jgi:hypothetical protein